MRRLLLLLLATTALAGTPDRLFLPGHTSALNQLHSKAANVLYCATVPAERTIHATKIAGYTAANNATTCTWAIYPNDDAGPLIANATGFCNGAAVTAMSLDFTLTAGTLYRVCVCASVGSSMSYVAVQQATSCCSERNVTQLVQAFHPTYVGTAATPCSLGNPPVSTGAITADATSPRRNALKIPLILVEE
jgi:hypothetical protein